MPTIEDGKIAFEAGNLQQARLVYEAILQETPRDEEAWLGLADVLTEVDDKRICYENVLKINSSSQAARDGLRSLDPEEDPFVAALKQQTATNAIDDDEFAIDDGEMLIGAEETMVSTSPPEEEGGTSTIVLIVAGLGLSLIVFAVLAGLIYFVLTSFIGP